MGMFLPLKHLYWTAGQTEYVGKQLYKWKSIQKDTHGWHPRHRNGFSGLLSHCPLKDAGERAQALSPGYTLYINAGGWFSGIGNQSSCLKITLLGGFRVTSGWVLCEEGLGHLWMSSLVSLFSLQRPGWPGTLCINLAGKPSAILLPLPPKHLVGDHEWGYIWPQHHQAWASSQLLCPNSSAFNLVKPCFFDVWIFWQPANLN